MCHFDGYRFKEVWKRAVWLFAWCFINILDIREINNDNLISHQEASEKWGETNHTDPVDFFADNGKTVDDFRYEVQQEIYKQLGEINMNVNHALEILINNNVISNSDYWLKACVVVKYLDVLIINMAKKLI